VADKLIRIFSDIHYGDRSSRVRSLKQLAPLFEGADTVVLNGDTLDTRNGPHPRRTEELRQEAIAFFARNTPDTVLITGNHDPDLTGLHLQLLGGDRVLVTHGDVLFETIVPWGRDVPLIAQVLAEERARLTAAEADSLEGRLAMFRRACARIPQRHQVEPNPWKHLISFALDTVWPPLHAWHVIRAWQTAPERAAALARVHRPGAQFVIFGHTHRPGIWRTRDGRVAINTGAFCLPFQPQVVELTSSHLRIRRIKLRNGEFHPGRLVGEFALAERPA
jgi:predicted phosphodiesterase